MAADYYWAMSQIECLFSMPEKKKVSVDTTSQLIILVDALSNGSLNKVQHETLQALWKGIIFLAFNMDNNKIQMTTLERLIAVIE
jgi:hypothetical protein